MNRQILKHYIKEYKLNFDRVNQEEIYKWQAVKCFQDNWNIDAGDFSVMLSKSLKKTKNLLESGQYFPLKMLVQYAEKRPEKVRQIFRNLYNEDIDLYERIQGFQSDINFINDKLFKDKKSYQDQRAIIVYLVLNYPERYFFYKYDMFKQFSEKLELIYKPKKGRIENIGHFNSLCEIIQHELSLDQDLLKLHKNRINADCYYDENLNILTQDFIYAVAQHLKKKTENKTSFNFKVIKENKFSTSELQITPEEFSFRGKTINFLQIEIENKRIGYLGELWVMKYEIEKLRRANKNDLIGLIKHTSKDEGDGTGYDIQSFDSHGNKIFIEVKTTKGKKNSTFFITRNELERSKMEKDNYLLYRLFNYNEENETADLLIIKGDLTNICEYPSTYKVKLKSEK